MDTLELIKARRSIRRYAYKQVPSDDAEKMPSYAALESAMLFVWSCMRAASG